MKVLFTIFTLCFLFTFISITTAQPNFYSNADNPVLAAEAALSWENGLIAQPYVLFVGTTYHMWYSAGSRSLIRIGYATSSDGKTWVKDTQHNPVLDIGLFGSWEESWVYGPCVIYDGSDYHMWYTGAEGNSYTWVNWKDRIGYATSPDGYDWSLRNPNPVMNLGPTGWENGTVATPFVMIDDTTSHMWYAGSGLNGTLIKIGHALSTAPFETSWTRDNLNPILGPGNNSSWDYPRVQDPRVVYDGSIYHMWYSGGDLFTWQIGHATSSDGKTWVKDRLNNPVLKKGEAGSWDEQYVWSSCVIFDGSIFKMWYTGGNEDWKGQIGYATSPDGFNWTKEDDNPVVTEINESSHSGMPEKFMLLQNYPNPFNPKTFIEYQLPKASQVDLSIYNILGQKVVTLVSEKQLAGSYKVDWDATGFASGVYYYLIQANEFQQVKKMVLLK